MKHCSKYNQGVRLFILNMLLLCLLNKEANASLPFKSAIQFTENKGQWPENVLFKSDIPIGNLFVEKNCLTYLFVDKEATHHMEHGKKQASIHFHAIKVNLLNANPNPQVIKEVQSEAYLNYFVGDPSKWASFVYSYQKITLKNIYPKIDLEILALKDGIKINFNLQAGANPNLIELAYTGADKIAIKDNELHVQTSLGELVEQVPVSFQSIGEQQRKIPTQFILNGNKIRFKLKSYNHYLPISIDPTVVFGTYVGSAADNFGFAASFDNAGNAYGAGTVYAANFPVTAGAYDVSFAGGNSANNEYARDAFIVKFNPTGSSLLFGTFIGGSDNEQPHSVTINAGEIIVFGTTASSNFPVTFSGFDRTYNGKSDLFVLKLNGTGSTLLASTFIGGSEDDGINGSEVYNFSLQSHNLPYNYADWFRGEVIADISNNIYISTCSKSTQAQGLPLVNASQAVFGGGTQDAYIIKLNNNLSTILYSTYIGSAGDESAHSMCFNNLNELIIGGGTTSSTLLYNSAAFSYSGDVDGFIAKFSGSGVKQKLIYIGTTAYDQVFFVQTDAQNNIYSLGQTNGLIPKTTGTYGQANTRQFLQKYDPTLSNVLASTTFGKSGTDPSLSPTAFMVDVCGRIYLSGWGGGTNQSYHNGMDNISGLPLSNDAFQKTTDGSDFYLMVLGQNFSKLLYASYYGGAFSQEHVDGGTSHFDKSGIVYQAVCAGCGGLSDFPTTTTAYSRTNPGKRAYNPNVGGCNLALFKFDMRTYLGPPVFKDTILTIMVGHNLNYDFTVTCNPDANLSMTGSGSVIDRINNPAILKILNNVPGLLNGNINWTPSCSDYPSDTIVIDLKFDDDACPNSNTVYGKIKIVIEPEPIIGPPFPECIKVINDSTLELKWQNSIADVNFLKYNIIRSINGGSYQYKDSIGNQISTIYSDPTSPDNLNINYCYQMVSLNKCGIPGDSSRTICSIDKNDTSTVPVFQNIQKEVFVLHAFDTLNQNFSINSKDPKDSVFIKLSGSFILKNKGLTLIQNQLGSANLSVNWVPTCADIFSDTLEIKLLVRDNACPNFRQTQKIIQFYVIPPEPAIPPTISCPKKINKDSVYLEWSAFQKKPFSKNLYLYRKVNGLRTLIAIISNLNATNYTDKFTLDPNQSTCYEISSNDICNYFGDTSAASCAQSNMSFAPDLSIYTATVQNNKDVALIFEQAASDSFWHYEIWKRKGRVGTYSLESTINTVSDTQFIDANVKVSDYSYCYQLVNFDLCGNKSKNNKEACTILLKGSAEPFSNHMNWLPYDYWSVGINRYEVLKTEPGLYNENLFFTTGTKPLLTIDNKLNYDNGLYEYTIMAYESLVGNQQTSKSNTINLIQLPLLYAPNAYTDNGDGLNDVFKTVPVFVKDYHLQIYNRWGERIFETYNKKEAFSGAYKSNEVQSDVYFYIVDFTGWDEKSYTQKGNFTILR